MIRAGDLDRRVTIQRCQRAQIAGSGETISVWSDIVTVAATVRQANGREFLAGSAIVGEQRAVFVVRFRADVSQLDRIAYGGRTFDIDDIREIGRREGLEIHAKAVR